MGVRMVVRDRDDSGGELGDQAAGVGEAEQAAAHL
jgi:hypothetical protein